LSKGFTLLTSSQTAHIWYLRLVGASLLATTLADSPVTILATLEFTAVASF